MRIRTLVIQNPPESQFWRKTGGFDGTEIVNFTNRMAVSWIITAGMTFAYHLRLPLVHSQ